MPTGSSPRRRRRRRSGRGRDRRAGSTWSSPIDRSRRRRRDAASPATPVASSASPAMPAGTHPRRPLDDRPVPPSGTPTSSAAAGGSGESGDVDRRLPYRRRRGGVGTGPGAVGSGAGARAVAGSGADAGWCRERSGGGSGRHRPRHDQRPAGKDQVGIDEAAAVEVAVAVGLPQLGPAIGVAVAALGQADSVSPGRHHDDASTAPTARLGGAGSVAATRRAVRRTTASTGSASTQPGPQHLGVLGERHARRHRPPDVGPPDLGPPLAPAEGLLGDAPERVAWPHRPRSGPAPAPARRSEGLADHTAA